MTSLFEEGGAQILPHVHQRSDQDVIRLLRVEDLMRLEAEAAIAGDEFVSSNVDARKVRQQAEGPLEARMVGFRLIAPEFRFGEGVDLQHIGMRANGKPTCLLGGLGGNRAGIAITYVLPVSIHLDRHRATDELTRVGRARKLTHMEKIQVYLLEEELEALRETAARSGRSVGEIIREAVRQVVLKPQASGPAAIWDGQPGRTSIDHDERNSLPPELADIADLIGSVDDDLPADLSARKKHYLRLWGYGRNRSPRQARQQR